MKFEPNSSDLTEVRKKADLAADTLKAIGSTNRLAILCFLMERPLSVGEISEAVGLRQSLTSQHLARLRQDDLVEFNRQDQTLIYSLKGELVRDIITVLCQHYRIES